MIKGILYITYIQKKQHIRKENIPILREQGLIKSSDHIGI